MNTISLEKQLIINCTGNTLRGALKKISQKVEKVQKGEEGSAKNIKKSKIRNLDFLIREGGCCISFFSQM